MESWKVVTKEFIFSDLLREDQRSDGNHRKLV